MIQINPQHEGQPHASQDSAPETEIDDYADTKPHFKQITPTQLMERNAGRTLSPDGTS